MATLLNAKERTFEEFEKIFSAADRRFKLKQWGEAGGAPSSGKSSLYSTPPSIYLSIHWAKGKN